MSQIDARRVQACLAAAGLYLGKIDGVAGPKTWNALFAFAARRTADATIVAIASAAALHFEPYGMTTPARIAEFVAQTSHETGNYTRFEEDLRYSAAAMVAQWPSHFTPAIVRACVGKPIEIAGRAYGGRMGNAAWPAQDGYTYRGRGMLQLTGRSQSCEGRTQRPADPRVKSPTVGLPGKPAPQPTTAEIAHFGGQALGNARKSADVRNSARYSRAAPP